MEFVRAHPEHDDIVVAHYLAIWESYGTPPDHLRSHPEEIVREFLKVGRGDYKPASVIQRRGGDGLVSFLLNTKAYPTVKPEHSTEGYIVSANNAYHLLEIGCTSVVLNSSEAITACGRPRLRLL
ncbi:hypothetical protein [Rhizobium leguminosarum]|uniref:hypothetical protein n=1 Tax=Rhizobium leguminosarum TaxID=384 RepID=UPI001C96CCA4|nr:hypothetical protein [Rhizobium leguminosarum]MBY5701036.1 hypothetical protein [Rhizobium leguminosarum]